MILQGQFIHDMDPELSILVPSRWCTEVDWSLSFCGKILVMVMDCLFQLHYSSIILGLAWIPPYLFQLHFQDSLTDTD